jgi:apolipoprotein D and lipocalin family protein
MLMFAPALMALPAVVAAESTDDLPLVPTIDWDRYCGTWYEIARLPNDWQEGLSNVTANYAPDGPEPGDIDVINQGWNIADQAWEKDTANAHCPDPDRSELKIVFFWPFSAWYRILALDDQDYRWALTTGSNRDYLWILCREPTMPEDLYADLVARAKEMGFAVERLQKTDHSRHGQAPDPFAGREEAPAGNKRPRFNR